MKHFALMVALLLGLASMAQTKMTSAEITRFKKEVLNQAEKTTSITANFQETQHVNVLKNALASNRIFRLRRKKLVWQDNSPKKNAMLFNKQQLKIKNDKGKITTIDLNKNKRFKQLQQLM